MPIVISTKVRAKLAAKQPPVTPEEIEQCFVTVEGSYLEDEREQHASDPPTLWFIAETYYGRKLKVVFIPRGEDMVIRTAYPPNPEEIRIYSKYGT
jgi:hypothetical protein